MMGSHSVSLPEASSLSRSAASRAVGTNRGPASASPSPAVSWPTASVPPAPPSLFLKCFASFSSSSARKSRCISSLMVA